MGMELRQYEQYRQGVEKFITASAAATVNLTVNEQIVRCVVDGTATVNLPPAVDCRGLFFSLYCTSRTSGAITLSDGSKSRDWTGNFTIDLTDDAICFWCDGEVWWVIENRIA